MLLFAIVDVTNAIVIGTGIVTIILKASVTVPRVIACRLFPPQLHVSTLLLGPLPCPLSSLLVLYLGNLCTIRNIVYGRSEQE